jgi:uncharacterized protein (TIGR03083 family)
MQQPGRPQYFAEIRASAAQLAEIASAHDQNLPVPGCPDWTLRQLATHLGRVHRWAAEIVSTRAAERIPFDSAPDGRYPAEPAEQAAWLNAGAERVIAAIAAAGDEPVWAFGGWAPAGFWARRQSHETMVHRADAELAVGRDVVLDAGLAVDGIDEWLAAVTTYWQRGDGSAALPVGAVLHVRATATEPGGSLFASGTADWLISSTPDGLAAQRGPGDTVLADTVPADSVPAKTVPADTARPRPMQASSVQAIPVRPRPGVSVSGPADRLLLVLLRRLPADDPAIMVTGDGALLTDWLAGTPF